MKKKNIAGDRILIKLSSILILVFGVLATSGTIMVYYSKTLIIRIFGFVLLFLGVLPLRMLSFLVKKGKSNNL